MNESIHDKMERVRKSRVHIKFDVDIGDAMPQKELPFVVGVIGDFSGDPTQELRSLSQRKFIQIDRDNFNEVMMRMTPGLKMRVKNTIAGDDSEMALDLKFSSMDDFEPAKVVDQVKPLKELKETRDKLRDLMSKADRSEKYETILERILENKGDELAELQRALGVEAGSAVSQASPNPDEEGK